MGIEDKNILRFPGIFEGELSEMVEVNHKQNKFEDLQDMIVDNKISLHNEMMDFMFKIDNVKNFSDTVANSIEKLTDKLNI